MKKIKLIIMVLVFVMSVTFEIEAGKNGREGNRYIKELKNYLKKEKITLIFKKETRLRNILDYISYKKGICITHQGIYGLFYSIDIENDNYFKKSDVIVIPVLIVNIKDETIENALKKILKPFNLTYEVRYDEIVGHPWIEIVKAQ